MCQNEPEDSERRTKGPFGKLELPTLQATSYGVACRLPVIESQGITVAVLLCRLAHGDDHHPNNPVAGPSTAPAAQTPMDTAPLSPTWPDTPASAPAVPEKMVEDEN